MATSGGDSAKKDVFRSLSGRLTKSIEVNKAVSEAFNLHLISESQRSDCLAHGTNLYKMGEEFVGILIRKINSSDSYFDTLVQVLKNIGEDGLHLAKEFEGG